MRVCAVDFQQFHAIDAHDVGNAIDRQRSARIDGAQEYDMIIEARLLRPVDSENDVRAKHRRKLDAELYETNKRFRSRGRPRESRQRCNLQNVVSVQCESGAPDFEND